MVARMVMVEELMVDGRELVESIENRFPNYQPSTPAPSTPLNAISPILSRSFS